MRRESMHLPIPVALGIFVKRRKHDRENDFNIVADQVAEILVVPEVQRPLGNLKVGTGNGFCELVEERLLNLGEFGWIHDFKDVLNLVEKHHFFRAVDLWPISEKTKDDLFLLA